MRTVSPERGQLWRGIAVAGAVMLTAAGVAPSLAHPPLKLTIEQEKVAAEEVADFRKKIVAAATAKNANALRELYADGFVHTTVDGARVSRNVFVSVILAGFPVVDTAAHEDISITVPGGWTAVATGRSTLPIGEAGAPQAVAWTIIYVRTDKSWQVVASQATRIAAPKR